MRKEGENPTVLSFVKVYSSEGLLYHVFRVLQ